AILHREDGSPFQMDRAVAIYEEYGGPLWRHNIISRRATNLVVKYYTMIENYDYGFVWRFKEDGTIEVEPADKNDLSYQGHSYGTLVRPHVEAIHHQHFFVFRLDMDIDGAGGN